MRALTVPAPPPAAAGARALPRVEARGKFLYAGDEKLLVRGVTYGTSSLDESGRERRDRAQVEVDFAAIAANGFNAVRLYTAPEPWLLDVALAHGLYVAVGLPWEQHLAFLERGRFREIERRVREAARTCTGHPSVLCYAVGNEIPASIVRWYGRRRIERAIRRLYDAVKAEDPDALVTYVNYPTTEYLQLPFLDLVAFNVYLEDSERYERYLARLQNIALDRPLLLAELGRDSRSIGEAGQAETMAWLVRSTFAAGAAGAFAFAWTDEWHRGGHAIEDWDFGLTRRDRSPKPALAAVRDAFAHAPFPPAASLPRISVVVCAFNAEATIAECLYALCAQHYPDFEPIVVDDGSTDRTAEIAARFAVRLIRTENRGLSNARNTGLEAATGEIVVYLDSDAFPDRDWLRFLADGFARAPHAAIGGPNLAPPSDRALDRCYDNAPGLPVQVLVTDTLAEHIPGCNMAFRRDALLGIGGFDPQLRVAGDDVDICWRLQDAGHTLGFSPGAMVWHHRRTTFRSYWRQQRGYGRAEALLERKWPERYNVVGHLTWDGRIYAKPMGPFALWRSRIYHGTWGSAPYQALDASPPLAVTVGLMPEWYVVVAVFAALSALGALWPPLLFALPLLAVAAAVPVAHALSAAGAARLDLPRASRAERLRLRAIVAALHLAQPLARLSGRFELGLTPWRLPKLRPSDAANEDDGAAVEAVTRCADGSLWSERWRSADAWLDALRARLRGWGIVPRANGPYDDWDLELRSGLFGGARALLGVEEHGAGRQLLRLRVHPVVAPIPLATTAVLALLAVAAAVSGAFAAAAVLAACALVPAARAVLAVRSAARAFRAAFTSLADRSR